MSVPLSELIGVHFLGSRQLNSQCVLVHVVLAIVVSSVFIDCSG
jgi:hypothetical protein